MKKSKFLTYLKNRSLSIGEFVDLMKIDRTTLWNWRNAKKVPSAKSMRRIRQMTNDELFYPEDFLDK